MNRESLLSASQLDINLKDYKPTTFSFRHTNVPRPQKEAVEFLYIVLFVKYNWIKTVKLIRRRQNSLTFKSISQVWSADKSVKKRKIRPKTGFTWTSKGPRVKLPGKWSKYYFKVNCILYHYCNVFLLLCEWHRL